MAAGEGRQDEPVAAVPFDIFLKLSDLEGESTDAAHKGWVEVIAFDWGGEQSRDLGSASPRVQRRVARDLKDLSITKLVDVSTPGLCARCAGGMPIKKATLEVCRQTGEKTPYVRIVLVDVTVSSVELTGRAAGGGAPRPVERITLRYDKISWKYTQLTRDGKEGPSRATGWSLVANSACYVD